MKQGVRGITRQSQIVKETLENEGFYGHPDIKRYHDTLWKTCLFLLLSDIRDENARQIELWIAAIESAFSPRMASGLSFATRLDKFVNTNKYTVNLNGRYQPTINLQSPDQKLRYRAMIVGIDERDKSNISAVRLYWSPCQDHFRKNNREQIF